MPAQILNAPTIYQSKAVKAKIEASAGGDFGYAFWKAEIIAKNVYDSQE